MHFVFACVRWQAPGHSDRLNVATIAVHMHRRPSDILEPGTSVTLHRQRTVRNRSCSEVLIYNVDMLQPRPSLRRCCDSLKVY